MLVPFIWVTPSWQAIAFGVLIGVFLDRGPVDRGAGVPLRRRLRAGAVSYTQLVWVSILGFMVFGELPDVWTVVGAAFIVGSGLYTAHRERVRRSQCLRRPASRRRTPERSRILSATGGQEKSELKSLLETEAFARQYPRGSEEILSPHFAKITLVGTSSRH